MKLSVLFVVLVVLNLVAMTIAAFYIMRKK